MKDKSRKTRLAVDYGTTAIGYALITGDKDPVVETGVMENPGRKYGRDVLSRIRAYSAGGADRITAAMREAVFSLAKNAGVSGEIMISANTTMNHMLLGYDCEGLATAPYTPVTLAGDHFDPGPTKETLDRPLSPFCTFPGFSAFVGGDIVSGVRHLDMDLSDETNLLIDLGTNGEMVLGNKDGFIVSSVAAGPAFEEWGASHGMYGSKVIDICYRLITMGIIDKNGTFTNPAMIENGFPVNGSGTNAITLTQDDIRDIQLAKAAVRAGVEILAGIAGISYDDIANVYLAGGMGEHLSLDSALGIGLLPPEFKNAKAVGNTSLSGAIDEVLHPDHNRLDEITKKGRPILLSDDPKFNDTFVKYMNF